MNMAYIRQGSYPIPSTVVIKSLSNGWHSLSWWSFCSVRGNYVLRTYLNSLRKTGLPAESCSNNGDF